jgi:hypothetical protein
MLQEVLWLELLRMYRDFAGVADWHVLSKLVWHKQHYLPERQQNADVHAQKSTVLFLFLAPTMLRKALLLGHPEVYGH